jgi:hypothetical protein
MKSKHIYKMSSLPKVNDDLVFHFDYRELASKTYLPGMAEWLK